MDKKTEMLSSEELDVQYFQSQVNVVRKLYGENRTQMNLDQLRTSLVNLKESKQVLKEFQDRSERETGVFSYLQWGLINQGSSACIKYVIGYDRRTIEFWEDAWKRFDAEPKLCGYQFNNVWVYRTQTKWNIQKWWTDRCHAI